MTSVCTKIRLWILWSIQAQHLNNALECGRGIDKKVSSAYKGRTLFINIYIYTYDFNGSYILGNHSFHLFLEILHIPIFEWESDKNIFLFTQIKRFYNNATEYILFTCKITNGYWVLIIIQWWLGTNADMLTDISKICLIFFKYWHQ